MQGSATGSKPGLAGSGKPKESRRWLKSRVPKEQLYRLAPPRPKPKRFHGRDGWSWVGISLRVWWIWLSVALLSLQTGHWIFALICGFLAILFYNTGPRSHPAFYALETTLAARSAEFRDTMAGMTGTPFLDGNGISIYQNGDEFYPAMLDAIEAARESITMEQYIFWDGQVGRRFAEAFAEKARDGVSVKLLVDAIGSANLGREIYRILEAGGCQLAWFRPIHWYTLTRANRRTHRKSLIVDGRVAFTGGAGIADHWLGDARNPQEWSDVQIKVEGPAARVQQSGFARNWLEATGEILSGSRFFPPPQTMGQIDVQTILSSPSEGSSAAGTMYLIALQCAREYLYIANPYFIPDVRTMEMLADARRRGVTVKVMLAGEHDDTWWARQNSLRLYGRLLSAGVELYEFLPSMLHQKTMVVDGVWATVGTTNFDNRSFALSEETNVCFHDPALVKDLAATFVENLASCRAVTLKDWRRRGLWPKIKERFASLIEDQV